MQTEATNPMMALLGLSGTAGKSSAVLAPPPMVTSDAAADGAQNFAAMIFGQVVKQEGTQATELALSPKALQEVLTKLSVILERLDEMVQLDAQSEEAVQTVITSEIVNQEFQALADVLEQLGALAGNEFVLELRRALTTFATKTASLETQPGVEVGLNGAAGTDIGTDMGTDTGVVGSDAMATVPEVLAALVDVTHRVRSQVVEIMQNLVKQTGVGLNVGGAKQAAVTQGLAQQAVVAGRAGGAVTTSLPAKKAANSAEAPQVPQTLVQTPVQSGAAVLPIATAAAGAQNMVNSPTSLVLTAATQPTQGLSVDDVLLPNIAPQNLSDDIKPLSDRMMLALFAPNSAAQSNALTALEKMVGGVIEVPRELMATPLSDTPALRIDAAQTMDSTTAQAATQARSPDAQSPRFASALIQQVRAVELQEGVTKIELTPRGLGSIEVEMKTRADGSLAVVVRAENAHVLNSLREERDLLAQVIADVGQGSVEFQEYSKNPDQEQGGSSSGGNDFSGGDLEVSEDGQDATQTAKIGGGQLDLMT
ncbi:MAG: flagellar hook-length control protein FliK [Cognatishimia sp.]